MAIEKTVDGFPWHIFDKPKPKPKKQSDKKFLAMAMVIAIGTTRLGMTIPKTNRMNQERKEDYLAL